MPIEKMKKGKLKILLFVVIILFIIPFVESVPQTPSFTSLNIISGDKISTIDYITASGSLGKAFDPLPDRWLYQNIELGFLKSYKIDYHLKLQHWAWDIWCPLGCWRDYAEKKFYHSLSVPTIRTEIYVYTSEDEGYYTYYTESDAEDTMVNFQNVKITQIPKSYNGYTWRLYIKANGKTEYTTWSYCYFAPWDDKACPRLLCGNLCNNDAPPYETTWYSSESSQGSKVITVVDPPFPYTYTSLSKIKKGSSVSIPVETENWGGDAKYCYFSMSMSDGLTYDPLKTGIDSSGGALIHFSDYPPGSIINDKNNNPIMSTYELLDVLVKPANSGLEHQFHTGIKTTSQAAIGKNEWLKYRYTCSTPATIPQKVNYPTSSSYADQQGWEVKKLDVSVYECLSNSECPSDSWEGGPFCQNNDVYQTYRDYYCSSGKCHYSDSVNQIQNCLAGYCDTFGKNYCVSNSVYHTRTCYNNGCSNGACYSNTYEDTQKVIDCATGEVCVDGQCVKCICTDWVRQGCGKGGCQSDWMYETRTCTPSGCDDMVRCAYSSADYLECYGNQLWAYTICGVRNYLHLDCGRWSTCQDNSCQWCSSDTANCNENPSDGCEVNLKTNDNNCGLCGNACSIGQICKNGNCVTAYECTLGTTCCDGTGHYRPSGYDCGTCKACDGKGLCFQTPIDDTDCGIVSCDDWHHIVGPPSPIAINYCYDSPDTTSNRCEGFGDCKDANTADCSANDDTLEISCGVCKYVAGCSGTTDGYCANYAEGTSCGTNKECDGNGNCFNTNELDLLEGWNLLSLPLNPTNNSINSIFKNINFSSIFSYGSWLYYFNKTHHNFNKINKTMGIWINSLNNQTLTVEGTEFIYPIKFSLKQGYNLISYPSLNPNLINESLKKINFTSIKTYKNNKWYSYHKNRSNSLNTLQNLTPGYAYWIKLPNNLNITFNGTHFN